MVATVQGENDAVLVEGDFEEVIVGVDSEGLDLGNGDGGEVVGGRVADGVGRDEEGSAGSCGGGCGGGEGHRQKDYGGDR